MLKLINLFKQHKTKFILAKISAFQVFVNFFTSLIILRTVGIGGDLDVYYIAMAVFAFLYSSINWSLSSVLAPYLIQHRGQHKEGRLLVTVLCITVPIALLLLLTMPFWAKVLYINYVDEIAFSKILWIQGILIGAYFIDGFILVYSAMLQEKNKYITFNLSMMVASLLGFLFVYFSIDYIGVYAAALNQFLAKAVIFIWMTLLFFKSIKPYIAFEKEQFLNIYHRAKYIILGSLYFKTDEVVEKYIASYLTAGFVSLVGFIQRVYGAVITVVNSFLGVPAITIFGNLVVEHKYKEARIVLFRYLGVLVVIHTLAYLGLFILGEWFFTLMMGDALTADLLPVLKMSILCLYALAFGKTISQLLQSLLMAMNKVVVATVCESATFTINVVVKIGLTILYGLEGFLWSIPISIMIADGTKLLVSLRTLKKKSEKSLK